MTTIVIAPIELLADSPDADRHAFPRPPSDGFPPGSICGQARWTVRMRPGQGGGLCSDCVTAMREELGWLTLALHTVDATADQGNHFAYPVDVIDERDGGRNER